jgi:hypothetical protein
MSTLTNVFSAHLDATGTIYAGATNLAGYQALAGGTAGEIVFRDGGASGTVVSGTITPAIGFHRFPANIGTSLYFTEGGTLDVTFFFASGN